MNIDDKLVRKTCERLNIEGHAHELTFTCYHRMRLLSETKACDLLVEAIARAKAKHKFALWAYVFMPDHVHLLIKPQEKNYSIATILQSIKQPVAQNIIHTKNTALLRRTVPHKQKTKNTALLCKTVPPFKLALTHQPLAVHIA